jgi:hypothetical protein
MTSLLALLVLLPADAGPAAKQLFNGRDLAGWEFVGPGRFVVENGLLKTEGGMGLLWYAREKFGNCTIRVVFKPNGPRGNSGVFIRIPEPPKDPWYAVHHGYEVQIEEAGDEFHRTGVIYSMSKALAAPPAPADGWTTMEITLEGQRTLVHVNGVKVTDFRGTDPVPDRKMYYEPERGHRPEVGYIGVQNHDADSTILFREISVRAAPHRP